MWVLVSRTVLAGLFIAVAAEAFDLLEERAAIAAPGRVSAVLAGLHDAGGALMRAMEAVAKAEDDDESIRSEVGHRSSAAWVKVGGAKSKAIGISPERRKTGYASTYPVAAVAAQRKKIVSAAGLDDDGMSVLSNGQGLQGPASEKSHGLSWFETVTIQPMQKVLMAALPLQATSDVEQGGRLEETIANRGGRATLRGSQATPGLGRPAGVTLLDVQTGGMKNDVPLTERTLFLLGPSNPVRLLFVHASRSTSIGLLVHLCVLLSSALLVLIPAAEDMPGQPAPPISSDTRRAIDLATTCVFSAELIIAVAAQVHSAYQYCFLIFSHSKLERSHISSMICNQ